MVHTSFVLSLERIVIGSSRGNRCEMSTLHLAEIFSVRPVHLVGAPEVAAVAILLPAGLTGRHTLVITAVGSWIARLQELGGCSQILQPTDLKVIEWVGEPD